MKDARIRQALDANLSGVSVPQRLHDDILDAIKGGKTMKRKLSVGLALALMLVMLCVTAVAATILNRVFEQVIDMEVVNGPIGLWSFDEKLRLVTLLSENGWDFPDDKLALLNGGDLQQDEKEMILSALITDALGREDAVSHMDIIEQVKGPMSMWSLEDKAWYTAYIRSRIDVLDTWQDILPEEGDLTPEQATRIAEDALLSAFDVTERELDSMIVSVSYFINGDNSEPRWKIDFLDDPYGSAVYALLLTRSGEVTEDERLEIYTPEHEAARRNAASVPTTIELLEAAMGPSSFWSLEDTAAWLGDDNGLPSANEISEAQAVRIAQETLLDLGADPAAYAMSVWYKRFDPYDSTAQGPFYAVYFIDDPDAPYDSYCVMIDPGSGEVLRTSFSEQDTNG